MKHKGRTIAILLAVALCAGGLAVWAVQRNAAQARQAQQAQAVKAKKTKAGKKKTTPAHATPAQVREKAKEYSRLYTEQYSYEPFTSGPYSNTALGVLVVQAGYVVGDEHLSDLIKQGFNWPDTATAKECDEWVADIKDTYERWQLQYWSQSNVYIDQFAGVYDDADRSSCQPMADLAAKRPKRGASKKSFDKVRDWYLQMDRLAADCSGK